MTRQSIHVLVVGADSSAVGDATVALATTGHTVSHVTPESRTPFVWSAPDTRAFDTRDIDVVLSIPGHALSSVPWCEDRVIDLVRQGIPLVLAGTPLASPFTAWATRCVELGADLVEVCENAVYQPPGDRHEPAEDGAGAVHLMDFGKSGGEALNRQHCLDLLSTARVGRVGLTSGALPIVLPVDYRLWKDNIVFRAEAGSRLDAAARDAVVAFEVDALGPTQPWGWSVMVTGRASDVTDTPAAAETDFGPVGWWIGGGQEHLIALSTDVLAGCRLHSRPAPHRPDTTGAATRDEEP